MLGDPGGPGVQAGEGWARVAGWAGMRPEVGRAPPASLDTWTGRRGTGGRRGGGRSETECRRDALRWGTQLPKARVSLVGFRNVQHCRWWASPLGRL